MPIKTRKTTEGEYVPYATVGGKTGIKSYVNRDGKVRPVSDLFPRKKR